MPVGAGGSGRRGEVREGRVALPGRRRPSPAAGGRPRPPEAVPGRLVGAGGDSLAVGQPMGWTGIMNVLPSGSLQGASGSANMAA